MRAVLVDQSNNIVNVVELDPSWQTPGTPAFWTPPAGLSVVLHATASKGWTYDGTTFTPPPANVSPPDSPRVAGLKADLNRADLMAKLQTATVGEIDTWLANNVTSLAQARVVLASIIKAFAAL